MTTETIFVRKPCNLQDVLRGTAEIRAIRAMRGETDTPDDDYYAIAAEVHLTAAEWAEFTRDMHQGQSWIADFIWEHRNSKAGLCLCIRVTGDGSQIALIVDPQGYDYARYVGIEPTA